MPSVTEAMALLGVFETNQLIKSGTGAPTPAPLDGIPVPLG